MDAASAQAALQEGLFEEQLFAEARMTETCVIDRILATDIDDEGREVVTDSTVIYVGPFRVKSYRPYPEDRDVGGSTSTAQMYDQHIPAVARMAPLLSAGVVTTWAGPVRNGDRLTRTTPGRASEVYRIETEHDTTDQTAQRLVARLITGGAWS